MDDNDQEDRSEKVTAENARTILFASVSFDSNVAQVFGRYMA